MVAGDPNAPDWLTARPIAHRGLHSKGLGEARGETVENTLAAATAAMAKSYAIECDIQRAGDGEAVVFHDFTLERLTAGTGRVEDFSAPTLGALAFKNGADRIPTLGAFLDFIDGSTPLIIEIKSRFDGDLRLAARALDIVADYAGPLALKSFDPAVLVFLRGENVRRPLGLVAQARYEAADWPELMPQQREELAAMSDFSATRPDFLSWSVADLPHATSELCRSGIGMPVITWTLRSASDSASVERWADQIIFEGFEP